MNDLQLALDRSLRNANPFTRSLFEESWDAKRVEAFVSECRSLTVATTTPRGEPHAAVVISATLDQQIFFTVSPESLLARNLQRNPRIAFTVCDRSHAVMGRGDAHLAGRSLEQPELIGRLASATKSGAFTPPDWDGLIYRIDIERIFAN